VIHESDGAPFGFSVEAFRKATKARQISRRARGRLNNASTSYQELAVWRDDYDKDAHRHHHRHKMTKCHQDCANANLFHSSMTQHQRLSAGVLRLALIEFDGPVPASHRQGLAAAYHGSRHGNDDQLPQRAGAIVSAAKRARLVHLCLFGQRRLAETDLKNQQTIKRWGEWGSHTQVSEKETSKIKTATTIKLSDVQCACRQAIIINNNKHHQLARLCARSKHPFRVRFFRPCPLLVCFAFNHFDFDEHNYDCKRLDAKTMMMDLRDAPPRCNCGVNLLSDSFSCLNS
jgi:hypothetical protein